MSDLTAAKADLARRAHGNALYEFYDCMHAHVAMGERFTCKHVEESPELFDDSVSDLSSPPPAGVCARYRSAGRI
jgi:hypothetical protein